MSILSLPRDQSFTRAFSKVVCLFAAVNFLGAEETAPDQPRFPSPDKKWEFRVINNTAVLVSAGSTTPALALSEEGDSLRIETAKLVWAPDSRRFALNYGSGGKYYTCDLYELAGTNWKQLPSLVDKAMAVHQLIGRALTKELKRLHSKKDALNSVMTTWKVLRWIDNDTLEAYVGDQRRVHGAGADGIDDDWEYLGCAISFRG
jgi:hypothetical protein